MDDLLAVPLNLFGMWYIPIMVASAHTIFRTGLRFRILNRLIALHTFNCKFLYRQRKIVYNMQKSFA